MNINKSSTINKPIKDILTYLSDIQHWVAALPKSEITEKKSDNVHTIKTKVNVGFFTIAMVGDASLKLNIEKQKIDITLSQNSKTISLQADMSVALVSKAETETFIQNNVDIALSGSMASVAKPLAEKIFRDMFDNLLKKLKDVQ